MRKALATDSTPPPDWSLSNETDARLDRARALLHELHENGLIGDPRLRKSMSIVGLARGTPHTRSINAPLSRTVSAWADRAIRAKNR